MNLQSLLTEGEALARPAKLLSPSPAASHQCVAYWGGECLHSPNRVPTGASALVAKRHIATFDAALLVDLRLPPMEALGIFEYETAAGDIQIRVEPVTDRAFSEIECSGERLFGRSFQCLPPFEALCLYGGEPVEAWMNEQGLQRHEYSDLEMSALAAEYRQEFERRYPLYTGEADVMVGGWHVRWPEDSFYRPPEVRLALTTFRQAEPWLELWTDRNGNFEVIARNT